MKKGENIALNSIALIQRGKKSPNNSLHQIMCATVISTPDYTLYKPSFANKTAPNLLL